jgi:hypothetical protein
VIVRTWRGAVRVADVERYLEHRAETGVQEYRQTPGEMSTTSAGRSSADTGLGSLPRPA